MITGAVLSAVQVTVVEAVAELPQPSTAVNVLVWLTEQLLVTAAPSEEVIVTALHASVALAEPSAALISEAIGLQSRVVAGGAVITGAVLSAVHVTVVEAVAELPQPSTAVNVLVWLTEQLVVTAAPSEEVIVTALQPSVALAEPSAALISETLGLQSRVVAGGAVITGAVLSTVHVTVVEAVAELPQPSTAVNVLTCVTVHDEVVAAASLDVIVTAAQPSVAVADPRAAVMSAAVGLQSSVTLVYEPVNVGGARSFVQLTVLEVVAELPQPSTAVNVLTCVTVHDEVVAAASLDVIVTAAQPSVAVADPRAAVMSAAVGLQSSVTLVYEPVNVGGARSLVQLTVLEVVAELPQPSTAVNVLTCVTVHDEVVAAASLDVIVTAEQPSVAVADPRAAVMSAAVGLQSSVTLVYEPVNVGGARSLVQLTVLEVVAELPQPSTAVNVLTCVTVHDEVVAAASLDVIVTAEQPSVAVADPRAAVMSAAVGLQSSVTLVYEPVNVGGARSLVQLTVLEVVAELPQPSTAVNVLTCVTVHDEVVAAASLDVIVTAAQPSVAVADPRAAVMSAAVGLQSSVTLVYEPVNVGGARSLVQLTVLEVVAELPQPSTAVNVLTWVTVHDEVVAAASLDVIVTAAQPSVAVADPRAAVMSAAVGLQSSVTLVYEPVNVGGARSLVQLTVLEVVAELPQPSTAVNVLTWLQYMMK